MSCGRWCPLSGGDGLRQANRPRSAISKVQGPRPQPVVSGGITGKEAREANQRQIQAHNQGQSSPIVPNRAIFYDAAIQILQKTLRPSTTTCSASRLSRECSFSQVEIYCLKPLSELSSPHASPFFRPTQRRYRLRCRGSRRNIPARPRWTLGRAPGKISRPGCPPIQRPPGAQLRIRRAGDVICPGRRSRAFAAGIRRLNF